MLQSTRFSPVDSMPAVTSAADRTLVLDGALHDLNNLLLIMATNAALASHHLPAEHPIQSHMRLAEAGARQAALLAQQMRNTLC